MKSYFLACLSLSLIAGCQSNKNSEPVTKDSVYTKDSLVLIKQTIKPQKPVLPKDPFEKIKDFTVDFYSDDYVALIKDLKSNKNLKVFENTNAGGGDADVEYLLLKDSIGNAEIMIANISVGEYGISNEIFYIVNKQLSKVRRLEVNPNENGGGYFAEETILEFRDNKVIVKKREKKINTIFAPYTLNDIPFLEIIGNRNVLLKQNTNILFETMQDFKTKK